MADKGGQREDPGVSVGGATCEPELGRDVGEYEAPRVNLRSGERGHSDGGWVEGEGGSGGFDQGGAWQLRR